MTENTNNPGIQVEESAPVDHPHEQIQTKERRSSIDKIIDAVKKPFHHEKKEKENPPALQEAIDKMKARKEGTAQKMEDEGKDTSVLSGKRRDIIGVPGTSK